MDNYILGVTSIDGYAHDNSVALLKNGKILFASSEERYSRIKHDGSFPELAIKGALSYTKTKSSLIKTVAVGFPHRNTFSVLANRYFYEIFPFTTKILINRNIKILGDLISVAGLLINKVSEYKPIKFLKNKKIIYVDHHKSHAASAFFTSGFKKSLSISIDAFGPNDSGKIRSGAVYLCDGANIREVMEIPIYASLGNFYQSVTYTLGFKPGDGEGKTMGLAAYGNPKKVYKDLKKYCPTFRNGLWNPSSDWLSGLVTSMPKVAYLFKSTEFGNLLDKLLKREKREDIAAAAQKLLEEEVVELVKYCIKKYPDYRKISLSGGTFLNVKTNKKIREIKNVEEVFVQPNAGDGGTALGAAFLVAPKKILEKVSGEKLISCGLGESFSDAEIYKVLKSYKNKIIFEKRKNILSYTTSQIINGKVIGWFQGRAEWGPRALGFRSVIADPRKMEIKERINHVLKNREWFMPFAPSVLEEKGDEYFKYFKPSPYMTMVFDAVSGKKRQFVAAVHVDDTARPNSVSEENNPIYYKLLKNFHKKTGLGIILNTSFNRHGLPIVNSVEDAIDHLVMGAVDELIIGKYSARRRD